MATTEPGPASTTEAAAEHTATADMHHMDSFAELQLDSEPAHPAHNHRPAKTGHWDATAEALRLRQDEARSHNWKRWGPYLSERQWGTVREDYSEDGSAWSYFSHDQSRSRAYRWGEDGLLGICDRQCRLCVSAAVWNGRDGILKERLFGLTSAEGNHGEDVKEVYFYLDSTPTHSYMKGLYLYTQSEYPYARLVEQNKSHDRFLPEYELEDTGAFAEDRYWDVQMEYCKADPEDVLIRYIVVNNGPEPATLHLIPQIWFRNTWLWKDHEAGWSTTKPNIAFESSAPFVHLRISHPDLGNYILLAESSDSSSLSPCVRVLFTENETNNKKVFGYDDGNRFTKDSFHRHVVNGEADCVRQGPGAHGTKAGLQYIVTLPSKGRTSFRLRLLDLKHHSFVLEVYFGPDGRFSAYDSIFELRQREADEFYASRIQAGTPAQQALVQRQAYAGMLWSKQFFYFVVHDWLKGDAGLPAPPAARKTGRNSEWRHLFNRDVISMPDKWEYPWYAAWDLAFHMIPFAVVDPNFAKSQLVLLLREWYMHPSGQIPAYEWAFSDVNPPVHAWAVWRVYKMTGLPGHRDTLFLARCFQKLILNFNWWVNRKDPSGKNVFGGGFLGLDNIGVFDRSKPLPTGGHLEQADGTSWMAFFCITMLEISLELAQTRPEYEDIASKFFEHFIQIVDAMNNLDGHGLWDEEDGFYYDTLKIGTCTVPLKVRSMVGLIPLFASLVLKPAALTGLHGFNKRMKWLLKHRKDLAKQTSYMSGYENADGTCTIDRSRGRLLAVPSKERLTRVLRHLFDENEFLSPHGVRSLSKHHEKKPFVYEHKGEEYRVDYAPADSTSALFGGNSNWRGPVWMPVNYLLVEGLERYHHFYGDSFRVEVPTGSGVWMNLKEASQEISRRLARIFLPSETDASRPLYGPHALYKTPAFNERVLFHEYFNPETGQGVGASHQTGWTGLITRVIDKLEKGKADPASE
eukprot:m.781272 g.781272  ORF g.781272 m.781272 type:complete len:972 (+) comp59145_c0_seq3:975-3890(+)